MSDQNWGKSEEEIIRQEIEERLKNRDGFYIHLTAFIGTNILLWIIWYITDTSFLWPLIPLFAWSVGIIAHWIAYYNKYGKGREKRQIFIEKQLREELERRSYYKPKNDNLQQELRLTEDGELSSNFVEHYFENDKREEND